MTKKRGYTYWKELIALLADGVWTNRKRYLCGYRQDEKCEHCGAEVENLPHILYQCPKWSTYWRPHENLREEVSKLPACASWCAHKPLELPEHLSKQWGEVQKIMATIVYERMNGEPNHWEEQRTKGKESHAERRETRPLPHYTERLHGGVRPWAFGRRAWHAFQYWAAHVRVRKTGCEREEDPTTLLEAMLSFIGFNGGFRFESEVGAEHNGAWVSVQLDRFRSAWLSFQHLSRAELLLTSPPKTQSVMGWGVQYGLPRLQLLEKALDYPARGYVWERLGQLPNWMAELPKGMSGRHDRWRRWTPGRPGSQDSRGNWFEPPRLWEIPNRRVRQPETPPPMEDRGAEHEKDLSVP